MRGLNAATIPGISICDETGDLILIEGIRLNWTAGDKLSSHTVEPYFVLVLYVFVCINFNVATWTVTLTVI